MRALSKVTKFQLRFLTILPIPYKGNSFWIDVTEFSIADLTIGTSFLLIFLLGHSILCKKRLKFLKREKFRGAAIGWGWKTERSPHLELGEIDVEIGGFHLLYF